MDIYEEMKSESKAKLRSDILKCKFEIIQANDCWISIAKTQSNLDILKEIIKLTKSLEVKNGG